MRFEWIDSMAAENLLNGGKRVLLLGSTTLRIQFRVILANPNSLTGHCGTKGVNKTNFPDFSTLLTIKWTRSDDDIES